MSHRIKVTTEVWIATALLHHDCPDQGDFSVREIVDRVVDENLDGEYRPGVLIHASQHCVANKRPSPNNYRMLYETRRGRRRLFRPDDDHHPFRKNGKTVPDSGEIPEEFHYLLEWYEQVYCTVAGVEEEQSPPELKKAVPDARGEQHESNTILGQSFQQQAADILSTHFGIEFLLEQAILIGDPAKEHRFDLVSTDQSHVGECKDYRWTETGNVPSAKISGINEAVLYLSCLPDGTNRFVVLPKSDHPSRKETLAEYYRRTYNHLLGHISVIEINLKTTAAHELGENREQRQEERSNMPSKETVWERIQAHAGEEFRQMRGKAFQYGAFGGHISLNTVNQNIPKSAFEKALDLVPLSNTVPLQHLRGPSYIYAILMDRRIRQNDW